VILPLVPTITTSWTGQAGCSGGLSAGPSKRTPIEVSESQLFDARPLWLRRQRSPWKEGVACIPDRGRRRLSGCLAQSHATVGAVMVHTSSVPTGEPQRVRISSGPRWDEVVNALDQAEQHLDAPLTSTELEHGWTEDMGLVILASVGEIKGQIAETRCVRPGHYRSWIRGD
jgi:hypothetical protein